METFVNILELRKRDISNFLWISRELNTTLAYKQNVRSNPEKHKQDVLDSDRIKEFIQKISTTTSVPKAKLIQDTKLILDEIGYNKELKIIRWLGLILTKICLSIYSGIYVNENSVHRVKSLMGKCPVIFLPSHRSYADFILMSYVCFTYDIEIPAIAAGMDFHAMWGMGKVLRDTGAFFMRRSINDDELYWETFKQYIHQIVTRGDLPIEFFIEGTRSRSCKSLAPKFGLLSMVLKPFFTREVPDVLIVPINVSYERVLEERLFAFELLGVPKPKESTSGFFKALSIIKEKYGNIYVDFGTPISAKQFIGQQLYELNHSVGPVYQQSLSTIHRQLISDIGYRVLHDQCENSVLFPFNLAATLLSTNKYNVSNLTKDILWLKIILKQLGARIAIGSVEEAFDVHKKLIQVKDNNVQLIQNNINLTNIDATKLKGYKLSNETMTRITPKIMLQLYVNPCLYYFANCGLCVLVIYTFGQNRDINKDELAHYFRFLRSMFSCEFAFYTKMDDMVFDETLNKLKDLNIIEETQNGQIFLSIHNNKLQSLIINLLNPFILAYTCVCYIIQKNDKEFIEHSTIINKVQKQLESIITVNTELNPYCLSLDTLTISIQSLITIGILHNIQKDVKTYKINLHTLNKALDILSLISNKCLKINESSYYMAKL